MILYLNNFSSSGETRPSRRIYRILRRPGLDIRWLKMEPKNWGNSDHMLVFGAVSRLFLLVFLAPQYRILNSAEISLSVSTLSVPTPAQEKKTRIVTRLDQPVPLQWWKRRSKSVFVQWPLLKIDQLYLLSSIESICERNADYLWPEPGGLSWNFSFFLNRSYR